MRKIYLLLLCFLCVAFYAKATTNYVGDNRMKGLLETIKNNADFFEAFPDFPNNVDAEKDWWKVPGFCFTNSGAMGQPQGDGVDNLTVAQLGYGSTDNTYYGLRGIDWRDKGYIQKVSYVDGPDWYGMYFVQDYPQGDNPSVPAQWNDMRWIKSVDMSGNFMINVIIDFDKYETNFTYLNLSNNPTLNEVSCNSCSKLEYISTAGSTPWQISIAQSGLSFARIYQLLITGDYILEDNTIHPAVDYSSQNLHTYPDWSSNIPFVIDIKKEFPFDLVDLRSEYEFRGNISTFEFFDLNGNALAPAQVEPGVFCFDASFLHKKVKCVIKNDFFPLLDDGVTLTINLAYGSNINNITKKDSYIFYNADQLFVKSEGKTWTDIYTISGQKVLSSSASTINVSSLNNGCYIAKAKSANGAVTTAKFIKY